MPLFGWRKTLEHTCFWLASISLILLGLVQGFQTYIFTLDVAYLAFEVLFIEAVASSFFFTSFLLISGFLSWLTLKNSKPQSELEKDRSISCIVPTYKDSEILSKSVESLLESDYHDFEVFIVCEEDDKEGIGRAQELSERSSVSYLVNTSHPGSKAGAINYAAEETDSEFIAVFDADQEVSKRFLAEAATLMKNNQVVQGRHLPEPENGLIESLAYYESLIFSYVIRQPLNYLTNFRLIGSRATLIDRNTFEQLGGYSDDTLTEDYDFAHKCYRQNVKTEELMIEPVTEEAAHFLKDWWFQRKRWMLGYFEVFSKNLRLFSGDYKNYRSSLSLLISGGSILGSILMLTLVSKFVILFLVGAESVYLIPLGSILLISLAGRFYDQKTGQVENIGFSWILTPLIFPLFSLITVKAFFEFLLHEDKSWYRVEKT